MQKTFIKYTLIVITSGILLILTINFLFTLHTLETGQYQTFHTKLEQIRHTLETNQAELALIYENLDKDYLTRAKAAEYMLSGQQDFSMDVSEMQYLAKLLDVDELHIIDENGFIAASSVSKYVGIDMDDHKQTRAFLALLESGDPDASLIQEMQPNAAENKIMKYVGVARKKQKGVVQVGFKPVRQLEAESRNAYDYVFSKFPTDMGEELFAIDCATGQILGHSGGMDQVFSGECYQIDELFGCTNGAYRKGEHGESVYVVSATYENVMVCAALPRSLLFKKLWKNLLNTLIYLLFVEAVVIVLLNYLVKRKVVDGIHQIIDRLSSITGGNLDTAVTVGGNREFEELSGGINTMVKSIVHLSDRISSIIEISGIPLAAFEYKNGTEPVFVTSGLRELLDLSAEKAETLCKNSELFHQYIKEITAKPAEGESDIFQINDTKYIRIHMSKSSDGCLGVITDSTDVMLEKKKMLYENTHDPLTGLFKYQDFKQSAAEILQKVRKNSVCAVVMLDLDFFKSINDTYGHDAGDQYLQRFSSIMRSMPNAHFLTARRSGDEFCMMIYDCADRSEIRNFLDFFYQSLAKHPVWLSETQSKIISASAGFALADEPDTDIAELLSHADDALYQIKRSTKGSYAEYIPPSV